MFWNIYGQIGIWISVKSIWHVKLNNFLWFTYVLLIICISIGNDIIIWFQDSKLGYFWFPQWLCQKLIVEIKYVYFDMNMFLSSSFFQIG